MQVKISFAPVHDFNQLIHALCSPPRPLPASPNTVGRGGSRPCPAPPCEKIASLSIPDYRASKVRKKHIHWKMENVLLEKLWWLIPFFSLFVPNFCCVALCSFFSTTLPTKVEHDFTFSIFKMLNCRIITIIPTKQALTTCGAFSQ